MRIRWTPAAAADLQGIYDYLKEPASLSMAYRH